MWRKYAQKDVQMKDLRKDVQMKDAQKYVHIKDIHNKDGAKNEKDGFWGLWGKKGALKAAGQDSSRNP